MKGIAILIKEKRMQSLILVALYYRLPSQVVFEDDFPNTGYFLKFIF